MDDWLERTRALWESFESYDYNPKDLVCPKCRTSGEHAMVYIEGLTRGFRRVEIALGTEHFEVRCSHCRYTWRLKITPSKEKGRG